MDDRTLNNAEFAADARHLVDCCLHGSRAAWEWLAAKYWQLCRRVAARVLGKHHASYAADVAQDAFLLLFVKLNTWRGDSHGSLAAWIARLVRRRAINFLRVLRRWSRQHRAAMSRPPDFRCTHLDDEQRWDVRSALDALGKQLTERQQRVLQGLVAERSQLEIAQTLGVSQTTVWKEIRLIRARVGKTAIENQDYGGEKVGSRCL